MARLVATVTWESNSKRSSDIYFELPESIGDYFTNSPDPFLLVAAPQAAIAGEKRLRVEGACPRLATGLSQGLKWTHSWFPDMTNPIVIETSGYRAPTVDEARIGGSLLSGGLDSLSLIRSVRNRLGPEHPMWVSGSTLVNWNAGSGAGIDVEAYASVERRRRDLEVFASESDLELVPLYSNALSLLDYPRRLPWGRLIHGMAFAGAAHALSHRFHTMFISASSHIGFVHPWGSHPMIDNAYCSGSFRFIHDGITLSRLEKASLVADWPAAMRALSVCVAAYPVRTEKGNCGECEKCLRTALVLLALGADPKDMPFPKTSKEDRLLALGRIRLRPNLLQFWTEMPSRLRAAGDEETAAVVDRLLRNNRWRARLRPIARAVEPLDRGVLGAARKAFGR